MTSNNVIDMDANIQQRRPNLANTGEDNANINNLFTQSVASSVGNYVSYSSSFLNY